MWILYSFIKWIFKLQHSSKPLNITAACLFVLGIIMAFFTSFNVARDFAKEGKLRSTVPLTIASSDTMYVKGFYNVCGVWPHQGCVRNDVVTYNDIIPNTILYIVMSTNAITECETGAPVIVENIFTSTYNRNLNTTLFSKNAIHLATERG